MHKLPNESSGSSKYHKIESTNNLVHSFSPRYKSLLIPIKRNCKNSHL